MTEDVCGISVVVPTHHGRERLTLRLLESLIAEAADFPGPSEIIVVDDESAQGSRVERACADTGAIYLREGWSAGAKRNAGAHRAQHDVVLFVDSDCVATPGLLAGHAAGYASDAVGGVAGPTDMYGSRDAVWDVVDVSREYNQCYSWPRVFERVRWSTTSNLSLRRDVFEKVGGFATDTWTPVGGEDVDLGVRVTDTGAVIVTNPDAAVRHTRENITRLRQVARSLFTYGRADVWLCDRHPDRVIRYRNGVGEVVLVAMAGLLLAPVRRVAAAAGPVALAALVGRRLVSRLRTTAPGSSADDPYGSRLSRPGASGIGTRVVAAHLTAIALDASFEIGTLVEATRRGRFAMWFRRFHYLDDGFVPRGEGQR